MKTDQTPIDLIRPGIRETADELLAIAGQLAILDRDDEQLQPVQAGKIGDKLASLGDYLDRVATWRPACPCNKRKGRRS